MDWLVSLAIGLSLAPAAVAGGDEEVVHAFDFTAPPQGEALPWLREQGFSLRMDAESLSPEFTEKGLVLSTDRAITGLFARELEEVDAQKIRVVWGVDRYPKGADWEEGVYRVPIAVMVSFGEEKVASGSMFVPNVPYFISLFLSRNAEPGKAYTANYYHKGGRYFCQPCSPPTGERVVTELDLNATFRETFGEQQVPPLSGFSFQMNTKDTTGGAQAFIERVEFLK